MRPLACGISLAMATVLLVNTAPAGDWQPLFNGQNLDGWHTVGGPSEAWKVEDGLLYCQGGGGGWLATDKEYENFEIELEFRVPPGGNSGVFLRAPTKGNPAFAGMEIQVLDDGAAIYKALQPYQYCGSLYDLEPPKTRASKPAGEWQKMHIVCNGRKVQVALNGTDILEADLDQYPDKEATHPGLARTGGFVGLQNHGTRLDYRNLRLRELP